MTVMDMTPEALFDIVESLRSSGQLTGSATRCKHRCHWFGTYDVRGQNVSVIFGFKLSPNKAAELGLEQYIPGRAWIGDQVPSGLIYGCRHFIGYTD